jgi:hypothetical protein
MEKVAKLARVSGELGLGHQSVLNGMLGRCKLKSSLMFAVVSTAATSA